MKNSPVSMVKDRYQSKDKLVEAVQKLASTDLWLDRVNPNKGLARISNQKLLRLHTLLSDAKSRFGSRDKLIGSILELEKRAKDDGYKARLQGYPLPRLLDLHGSLTRAAGKQSEKAEAKKKAPATAAEKAERAEKATKKAAAAKAAARAEAKKMASKRPPAKKGASSKTRKV
jgi:hypothetical protein